MPDPSFYKNKPFQVSALGKVQRYGVIRRLEKRIHDLDVHASIQRRASHDFLE